MEWFLHVYAYNMSVFRFIAMVPLVVNTPDGVQLKSHVSVCRSRTSLPSLCFAVSPHLAGRMAPLLERKNWDVHRVPDSQTYADRCGQMCDARPQLVRPFRVVVT